MENHFENKNYNKRNKKTAKINIKMPHVNKKTTSEKANSCSNTIFLLYFKIRAKNLRRKAARFFASLPASARPKS